MNINETCNCGGGNCLRHGATTPVPTKYPRIEATMGLAWLSTWSGRFTDVEMQRMEDHFASGIGVGHFQVRS